MSRNAKSNRRSTSPSPSLRSQSDVQYARALSSHGNKKIIDDIHTALDNISHAESLAERGNLARSLDIYTKSIGVLIQATNKGIPGVDDSLLKERALVALNDAEKVKKKLKGGARINRSSSERRNLRKNIQPAVRSCSVSSLNNFSNSSRRSLKKNDKNDPLVEQIESSILLSSPPSTKWNDISGLHQAKHLLQEAAILPILRPDLYKGLRSAPRGILLYGPPGTGKTMLAKAVAHESNCAFFSCSSGTLLSKYHGEGEKLLKALFDYAGNCAKPAIIFFDEIDALLSARKSDEHEASRRFKTEFMVQVDGVASSSDRVLVLGCTNCPWDLDDAVMRRFQRRIFVPLPDTEARRALLHALLQKNSHSLTKKNIDKLVRATDGYSCSDLNAVGRDAAFGPLRDLGGVEAIKGAKEKDLRKISFKDFEIAIKNCRKSISSNSLKKYNEWERDLEGTS